MADSSGPPAESGFAKATFTDHVESYEATLRSMFVGKGEDTQSDLSRIFTPDFIHYDRDADNLKTLDFAAFVAHIRWLRDNVPPGKLVLTVTQFLRDGNQLAERHCGPGYETFQFAEIADDGRIRWIVERQVKKKGEEKWEPRVIGDRNLIS